MFYFVFCILFVCDFFNFLIVFMIFLLKFFEFWMFCRKLFFGLIINVWSCFGLISVMFWLFFFFLLWFVCFERVFGLLDNFLGLWDNIKLKCDKKSDYWVWWWFKFLVVMKYFRFLWFVIILNCFCVFFKRWCYFESVWIMDNIFLL